jgi:hypothetical protein
MSTFTLYKGHTKNLPVTISYTGSTLVITGYTAILKIGTGFTSTTSLVTVTGSTITPDVYPKYQTVFAIPTWTGSAGTFVFQVDIMDSDELMVSGRGEVTVLPALP